MHKKNQTKAVFLDRDGVVNVEKNYLYRTDEFEFLPSVIDAVKAFNENGFLVVIVTNQSGIARGYYTQADYEKLTAFMLDSFTQQGAKVDAVYHCPHDETSGCDCRKPLAGMFLKARDEHNIDMANSWVIGDKQSDVDAALKAGVGHTILVRSGHPLDEKTAKADKIVNGIFDTIDLITRGF